MNKISSLLHWATGFISTAIPALAMMAVMSVCGIQNAGAAASKWQDIGGGKARLVAVLDPASNIVSGAIEIALKPGWKTYWRNPGSSGIPPEFDFSQSIGFTADEVKFPVPRLIKTVDGVYAGYKENVTFLFEGQLLVSSGGSINLQMFIGVCEEICIPAQATFGMNSDRLMTTDLEASRIITTANLALPASANGRPVVVDVTGNGNQTIKIKVVLDEARHDRPFLFVEGPQDWYLTPATLVSRSPDSAVFELDVSDIPEGADPLKTKLRFTLVSGSYGIEVER